MSNGSWIEEAKKNTGLLIFLGVMTVIFGFIAMVAPLFTGVAVSMVVGVLLLIAGITRIVHAFKSGQWGTGILGTLIGLLGVIAGLLMIFRPMAGLLTITLLLAIYFIVEGIFEIIASFRIKPDSGWGWVLFSGIVAVLLGWMIWSDWPVSGVWAVGILVGVHMIFAGFSMIFLGTGAKKVVTAGEKVAQRIGE